MRRVVVALAGLALASCGIKGTPPQPKDPAPVADLRVEGRDGAVRLSWRGRTAGGVTAFDVLRKLDQDGVFFEKLATVSPAGTRTYHYFDRGIAPGASYVYRVRPRRIDPEPSEIRFSGPQGFFAWNDPPEAPTDVTSVPLNAGARLSWNPVSGSDGYRVYALRPDKSAKEEPANRGLIDKTSWVAVALADGKAICYVVRSVKLPEKLAEARNAAIPIPGDEMEAPTGAEVGDAAAIGLVIPRGNAGKELSRATSELAGEGPLPGVESPSSEATCVTPGLTEPPAPPKLLKTAITSEGISLSWKKSPGEEVIGYHVERRETNKDGTPIDALWQRITEAPVATVGFIDKTVVKAKWYEYRVRAVDAAASEGPPATPTRSVLFNP